MANDPVRSMDGVPKREGNPFEPRDGSSSSSSPGSLPAQPNSDTNTDSTDTNSTDNDIHHDRKIVAVTGASGFVGSHLCEELLKHGYTVRACVRSLHPSRIDHLSELAATTAPSGTPTGTLELRVADMSQRGAYDRAFEGCSAVFHVAGNFGTDYHSVWKKKDTEKAPAETETAIATATAATAATSDPSNEAEIGMHQWQPRTFREIPAWRLPPADALLRTIRREQRNCSRSRSRSSSSSSSSSSSGKSGSKHRKRSRQTPLLGTHDQSSSSDEEDNDDDDDKDGDDSDDGCWPSYDHAVYRSYVEPMEWLLESVRRHSGTIRTVVYTSSGAAGGTIAAAADNDNDGDNDDEDNDEPKEHRHDASIRENAYGQAKKDCERLLYEFCRNHNTNTNTNTKYNNDDDDDNNNSRHHQRKLRLPVVGISVCPCIVLGPIMGTNNNSTVHDRVFQHRWSDMLRGRYLLWGRWEVADVRDVATVQRLLAEAVLFGSGGGEREKEKEKKKKNNDEDNDHDHGNPRVPSSISVPNGTRVWIGLDPSPRIRSLLEWIAEHDDYRGEQRLDALRTVLETLRDSSSSSDSASSGNDSGSDSDESGNGSGNDGKDDAASCELQSQSPERNRPPDCDDGDGDGGGDGSSSRDSGGSESSSDDDDDEDSFGVPDWDHDERNQRTTTWSNPVVLLGECGYRPRTPWQTLLDTTRSILDRWEVLGAERSLAELCDLYTVAEMDGCSEELEWLRDRIRSTVRR